MNNSFKAVMKDDRLFIYPNVERDIKGNVTVHALTPQAEQTARIDILSRLAKGEKVEGLTTILNKK